MLRAPIAAFALLVSASAAADCPADADRVREGVGAALDAFAGMDVERFSAERGKTLKLVACLSEVADPRLAAEIHRLEGMGAFVARDTDGAGARFRAAAKVDETMSIPEAVAPAGHPMSLLFEANRGAPDGDVGLMLLPADASAVIDGTPGSTRPMDRPILLQLIAPEGPVLFTGYVDTDAALPDFAAIVTEAAAAEPVVADAATEGPDPIEEPVTLPDPPQNREPSGLRGPLLGVAGVGALAAGGLTVAALGKQRRLTDPGGVADRAEADGVARQANTLFYGAQVGMAVAVGAGVGAFVVSTDW